MNKPAADNKILRIYRDQYAHKRSLLWIALCILALMMMQWMPFWVFETVYYQILFPVIRVVYDFLFGWFPIPMVYIGGIILLVRIVKWINEMQKGIVYQATRFLGGICALIFLFYILWGFNYRQLSLQSKLKLDLDAITLDDIREEFQRATVALQQEAANLPDHYTSDEVISRLKVTDKDLRPEVEKALKDLSLPSAGKVQVRQLWPPGFLLRWGTAGIYIPHVAEGHIDGGLLSVQKPFTLAHEMAHGYGVTDEGTCNFIAWLACRQSRDSWIRFGGAFTYWRYAAAEMPDSVVFATLHALPPVVERSLNLIRLNDRKYPDILPGLRDAVYSSYLEGHGVKGGLRSYNYVVTMVHSYLKRGKSFPGQPAQE